MSSARAVAVVLLSLVFAVACGETGTTGAGGPAPARATGLPTPAPLAATPAPSVAIAASPVAPAAALPSVVPSVSPPSDVPPIGPPSVVPPVAPPSVVPPIALAPAIPTVSLPTALPAATPPTVVPPAAPSVAVPAAARPIATIVPVQSGLPVASPSIAPASPVAIVNPWGYNFACCKQISAPPATFCTYFTCIASFWNGTGYVMQCRDLMFSKSGGISESCSSHGGNLRSLLSP